MKAVRYRTGVDANTGKIIRGWPHCAQCLSRIWMTQLDTMLMYLDFGSEHRSRLGEDITPDLALQIYDDLTVAAHKFEREYRVTGMQLVHLKREGVLGLRHTGRYYPEGRLGNYSFFEKITAKMPYASGARTAVGSVA